MDKENLPVNPIGTFGYQRIVEKRMRFVYFQLLQWYNDLPRLEERPPRCDFTPAEQTGPDSILLSEAVVSKLFAYHDETFYLFPELDEAEYAWILPYLEAYIADETRGAFFTREQVRYLLWICSFRRVSVEWAGRLACKIALEFNETQQRGSVFILEDPDAMAQEWENAFRVYVESYRQEAAQWQAEQEARWAQAEARQRVIGLLQAYAQEAAPCWKEDAVQAEVCYFRLRGVLDTDGILWITGQGKLHRKLLEALPEESCASVRGLWIGEGITDIECEAFCGPWSQELSGVHFPETLRNIKREAFSGCSFLTWAPLPPRLRYIGERAFAKCKALEELTLPDSMEYLHTKAFEESGVLPPQLPEGAQWVVPSKTEPEAERKTESMNQLEQLMKFMCRGTGYKKELNRLKKLVYDDRNE